MTTLTQSNDDDKLLKLVQSSTHNLMGSFRDKTQLLIKCSNDIKLLIREGYDVKIAKETAEKFFGKKKISFIAIDGTESQDQELDMLIFYAGAFGYIGQLEFVEEHCSCGEILEPNNVSNVSAAIPVHEEDASNIVGEATEGGIEVDSERLPSTLMQFAEYYMAVKAIYENPDLKLILLDRTLAGDAGHLIWSVNEGQKVLIPAVVNMIKHFMEENKLNEDSLMGVATRPLIISIMDRLSQAKLRADAAILSIFINLQVALEECTSKEEDDNESKSDGSSYDTTKLINEILNESADSPKLFVINLPEADVARYFCAEIIDRVFRRRKSSFTLTPRIVFVFDEAQEFIPAEKRKEDRTDNSSRAVERLLRHGRKYNLNGWISTQRIAHLNTNALQQLHSYFVSTMPRPYDRQLISDTFAIDDAFIDRTLMFQNRMAIGL